VILAMPQIDYFFTLISPWAYLGHRRCWIWRSSMGLLCVSGR
jgi:2-hydroxychromene-2-carboxylate isomerase